MAPPMPRIAQNGTQSVIGPQSGSKMVFKAQNPSQMAIKAQNGSGRVIAAPRATQGLQLLRLARHFPQVDAQAFNWHPNRSHTRISRQLFSKR